MPTFYSGERADPHSPEKEYKLSVKLVKMLKFHNILNWYQL